MSFRWFGPDDPVRLEHIRQIPAIRSIVSALYDVPVGAAWTRSGMEALQEQIDGAGLKLGVVESIPVHEDIKLGRPTRDVLTERYCESVTAVGEAGVRVVCYNFMPVFDWLRTDLAARGSDGATALAYEDSDLAAFDLSRGTGDLPGWATAYDADALARLLSAYRGLAAEQMWEHLAWFLERVVPTAEAANVRLAIHPDDPPWPVFGLPRILTSTAALERLTNLVDSAANGVTFCTGSLAAAPGDDLPAAIRRLGQRGRIHFAHCRNVKRTGHRSFREVAHPSRFGDVDMLAVVRALRESGFDGYIRPDHGRMIWDETGRPGYGLYDRALGAMYLQGLWEAVASEGSA